MTVRRVSAEAYCPDYGHKRWTALTCVVFTRNRRSWRHRHEMEKP